MNEIMFPGREFRLRHPGNGEMPFHSLAGLFPMMEKDDLGALKDDIVANGLREPIVLHEGLILDGRNRFLACHQAALEIGFPDFLTTPIDECMERMKALRIPIRYVAYTGTDPLAFVVSMNLHRRHLNESQRAMVAAKWETLKRGRPEKGANLHGNRDEAADLLNVSRRSVASAAAVRAHGTKALVKAVEQGAITVSVAAKVAKLPKEQQHEAVAAPAKAKHLVKRTQRDDRESALAAKTEAASKTLGRKLYPVIYADPPWQFSTWSENGKDRSAENHYPTMTLDKLKAMPVPAAADCVLFLWATVPMLPQALEVIAAWGFTYKSHCVWVKDRTGTGYWFRNKHELLLVGTRGNIPAPAPGEQMDSVIECAARRHSEKPAAFAELIDGYFPTLEGIELFARGPRLGWDTWGAESDTETQGD